MNSRERFLRACRCEEVDRPPVWIMRQAGRYLPEYRELREKHSFHDVVENPELACEVTMQPLRRFDLDAAIIFSDILVIPEALGQNYGFPEGGGIEMDYAIREADDLQKLDGSDIAGKLGHVGRALERTREALGDDRALIGFGGSPWTLATYMVEGGSSKNKRHTKAMYYSQPEVFEELMTMVTDALVDYFEMQIEAGVDALQIFDSWGGALAPNAFEGASVRWMRRLVDEIDGRVPVVVFSKGMHHLDDMLVSTGADILGIDWTARLDEVRDDLPDDVGVQGNLDPTLLSTNPEIVERETQRILETMDGRTGHIFNLGHGILPSAKPENVARLVDTVTNFG